MDGGWEDLDSPFVLACALFRLIFNVQQAGRQQCISLDLLEVLSVQRGWGGCGSPLSGSPSNTTCHRKQGGDERVSVRQGEVVVRIHWE